MLGSGVSLRRCPQLQPKFSPAGGILGNPGTLGVLGKKSWGLEKRKRNAILSLKSAGLHSTPPTHLVPNRALLHLFPSTHSAPILCTCMVNYPQTGILTNYVHSEPSHSPSLSPLPLRPGLPQALCGLNRSPHLYTPAYQPYPHPG